MSAMPALDAARRFNVSIMLNGAKLVLEASEKSPDYVVDLLRADKAEIVGSLSQPAVRPVTAAMSG
jgi:hypothetical protein